MVSDGVAWGATAFACALGLAALVGGIYLVLRARFLDKHCTATVQGSVVDILDESFKGDARRAAKKLARREKEADEQVIEANEAIAAKKRAYNAKRRRAAEEQARASASTWRPVVRYEVAGVQVDARATRGVSRGRYKVGDPCEVHYDPACPKRCWLQIDGLPGTFGTIICVCGVVLIGIGVACWFVLPAIANLAGAM